MTIFLNWLSRLNGLVEIKKIKGNGEIGCFADLFEFFWMSTCRDERNEDLSWLIREDEFKNANIVNFSLESRIKHVLSVQDANKSNFSQT